MVSSVDRNSILIKYIKSKEVFPARFQMMQYIST